MTDAQDRAAKLAQEIDLNELNETEMQLLVRRALLEHLTDCAAIDYAADAVLSALASAGYNACHDLMDNSKRMKWPAGAKFAIGDRVRKVSGTWWEGRVCGFYSTKQTPIGYCVQLDTVPMGPVQIYPEQALVSASQSGGEG